MKNKDKGRFLELSEEEYKELLRKQPKDTLLLDSNLVPVVEGVRTAIGDFRNTFMVFSGLIVSLLIFVIGLVISLLIK